MSKPQTSSFRHDLDAQHAKFFGATASALFGIVRMPDTVHHVNSGKNPQERQTIRQEQEDEHPTPSVRY